MPSAGQVQAGKKTKQVITSFKAIHGARTALKKYLDNLEKGITTTPTLEFLNEQAPEVPVAAGSDNHPADVAMPEVEDLGATQTTQKQIKESKTVAKLKEPEKDTEKQESPPGEMESTQKPVKESKKVAKMKEPEKEAEAEEPENKREGSAKKRKKEAPARRYADDSSSDEEDAARLKALCESDKEHLEKAASLKDAREVDAAPKLTEPSEDDATASGRPATPQPAKSAEAKEDTATTTPQKKEKTKVVGGDMGTASSSKASRKQLEVFVGGVPFTSTVEQVKKDFGKFGDMRNFSMPKNKEGSGHRGICFITYVSEDGVKGAIALNNTDYRGRKIKVHIAEDKSQKKGDGKGKQTDGKGKGKGGNDNSERTVYVRGIAWSVDKAKLQTDFEECGAVERVNMPLNEKGKPKGIAFITFKTIDSMEKALQKFNDAEYAGRTIGVKRANEGKPDKSKQPESAQSTADDNANSDSKSNKRALTFGESDFGVTPPPKKKKANAQLDAEIAA